MLSYQRIVNYGVCMRLMMSLTTACADVLEKLLYIPPIPHPKSIPP